MITNLRENATHPPNRRRVEMKHQIESGSSVEHKVRFLLSENGYHGSVSTRAFYSDKNHFSDELVNEYCNYGFLPTLFKGEFLF
ncbi:hypothetical protein YC2023_091654 [Brassica napus]